MNQKEVAMILIKKLHAYGAYLYHEAQTGSIYIKFPHWALGSIRVGDHNGYTKYRYRWRVRLDVQPGTFKRTKINNVVICECSTDKIDALVQAFVDAANNRTVNPGDIESWEDRKKEKPKSEREKYLNWYEDKKIADTQAISVRTLRELGYAVILYYPEELNGIEPRTAETMFVEACNQIIEDGRPH